MSWPIVTNKEKRERVTAALANNAMNLSNGQIAHLCGVSEFLVRKLKGKQRGSVTWKRDGKFLKMKPRKK